MFEFIDSFFEIAVASILIFFGLIFLLTFIMIIVGFCKGKKIPKRKCKSKYKNRNIV